MTAQTAQTQATARIVTLRDGHLTCTLAERILCPDGSTRVDAHLTIGAMTHRGTLYFVPRESGWTLNPERHMFGGRTPGWYTGMTYDERIALQLLIARAGETLLSPTIVI